MILKHVHIHFTHFLRAQQLWVTILKFIFFLLILWPLEAICYLAFFVVCGLIDVIFLIFKFILVDIWLRH